MDDDSSEIRANYQIIDRTTSASGHRRKDDDYDNSIIHVNGITTGLSNRTGIASKQPIGLDKPNLKSLSEWYEEM